MAEVLSGINEVLRNLERELKKIQIHSKKGMYKAILRVERQAEIYTPVDIGNLIGSYEVSVQNEGSLLIPNIVGEIKVGANYALKVHEMPKTYHFKKPGSGPKYLERALNENQVQILEDIREEVQIK